MYEDVKLTTSQSYLELPKRLRKFLDSKFSSINRAIEYLQISSSTMYSYIPSESKRKSGQFVTPNVQFLMKISSLGCNLHWLLTGEGEMEIDRMDFVEGSLERKRQTLSIVAKYNLVSPEHLDDVLGFVVSLTGVLEYTPGKFGLTRKSPEDYKPITLFNDLSEEEVGKRAAGEFNEEQERKREAAAKPGGKSQNPDSTP